MKNPFRTKGFWYSIITAILVCVAILIFCFIVGGKKYWYHAGSDDSLFFFIIVGQIAVAVVLLIILVLIKPTRRNGLWVIIPLILIGFALFYDPVLRFIWSIVYCC